METDTYRDAWQPCHRNFMKQPPRWMFRINPFDRHGWGEIFQELWAFLNHTALFNYGMILQTVHKKIVISGKRDEEGDRRDTAEKTTQKHYHCLCDQLVGFRDKQTIFLQAFLTPQGICCRRFQPAVVSRSRQSCDNSKLATKSARKCREGQDLLTCIQVWLKFSNTKLTQMTNWTHDINLSLNIGLHVSGLSFGFSGSPCFPEG